MNAPRQGMEVSNVECQDWKDVVYTVEEDAIARVVAFGRFCQLCALLWAEDQYCPLCGVVLWDDGLRGEELVEVYEGRVRLVDEVLHEWQTFNGRSWVVSDEMVRVYRIQWLPLSGRGSDKKRIQEQLFCYILQDKKIVENILLDLKSADAIAQLVAQFRRQGSPDADSSSRRKGRISFASASKSFVHLTLDLSMDELRLFTQTMRAYIQHQQHLFNRIFIRWMFLGGEKTEDMELKAFVESLKQNLEAAGADEGFRDVMGECYLFSGHTSGTIG